MRGSKHTQHCCTVMFWKIGICLCTCSRFCTLTQTHVLLLPNIGICCTHALIILCTCSKFCTLNDTHVVLMPNIGICCTHALLYFAHCTYTGQCRQAPKTKMCKYARSIFCAVLHTCLNTQIVARIKADGGANGLKLFFATLAPS